jgi:D-amino-acid dehydrogenase
VKIAVIGAGLAGVATAHVLVTQGHDVTLIERRGAVAEEGSFAPGAPWGLDPLAPWWPAEIARTLGAPSDAMAWWPVGRAGRKARQALAQSAGAGLDAYSRHAFGEALQRSAWGHERGIGHMVLLRDAEQQRRIETALELLSTQGAAPRLLDAAQARALEPALHEGAPLAGALLLPHDASGNARLLAQHLRAAAQAQGLRVITDGTVVGLAEEPGRAQPWTVRLQRATAEGETEFLPPGPFDAVVLCAGAQTSALARGVGWSLPLTLRGAVSVTVPMRWDEALAPPLPSHVLTDAGLGISMSRLGQRVRVAAARATAPTVAGPAHAMDDCKPLFAALDTWIPGSTRVREAQAWSGAVACTPDGLPVVGTGPRRGLWVNGGHGHAGLGRIWGSALVLSDLMAGRPPGIDATPLAPGRFSRPAA